MSFSLGKKWEEIIAATYATVPNGYRISKEDRAQIDPDGKGAVYGEMPPKSMEVILKEMEPTKEDVFADLGSGTGKIVIQVALTRPVLKARGIELSKERFSSSVSAKSFIHKFLSGDEKDRWNKTVEFVHENILDAELNDVTCAFLCSTCFSNEILDECAFRLLKNTNLRMIATLARFSFECEENFDLVKEILVPTSWSGGSKVYFYKPKR